ncbi:MAG: shikimate dehydrogenase [Polaromonas sp.]|nr:shikimate dehydrogenase [Polaromonas sp.]
MLEQLNGATRIHFIVGDPIAQVKSPRGVTQAFEARGHNALVVPAHVAPEDLVCWLAGTLRSRNVDGIIVTVPHKFAAFELCATTSDRARFLSTVNTMRRNADGRWHGDMFDGLGFVAALMGSGCQPAGKRALLVGAGGAGSAIAHAVVMAGVSVLAIHDENAARRDMLIRRLGGLNGVRVKAGSASPEGYDVVLNATPIGMKDSDPFPVDVTQLAPHMHVGCVITAPAITPLIAAARAKGCTTQTGADMFAKVRDLMVDFLLEQ